MGDAVVAKRDRALVVEIRDGQSIKKKKGEREKDRERWEADGSFKPADLGILRTTSLPVAPLRSRKAAQKHLVHAAYRDGGRPNSADIFVGGFILGGLVVGALGCVYAPQVIRQIIFGDHNPELLCSTPFLLPPCGLMVSFVYGLPWLVLELCVQSEISKALAGADKKELLRKLPKFIYDEEKALEVTFSFHCITSVKMIMVVGVQRRTFEFGTGPKWGLPKTRKVLTEKIEQLNSAIDDISGQLRSQGIAKPKKAAVKSEDVQGLEASV
ncbi:hypothetical protein Cgig2_021636 [Carnegiea gigantea]|uniref:Uncharacterized protein n=1 Tax=Carnegiea gigantea TaxID=171969 RepID=A0A9Q1GVT8_9CARY|nr:hypothetical protein Cgig2_021636 [Carnegiea gigantea]